MSTTLEEAGFRLRLSQIMQQFESVAELARAVGVSDNAIYKWISGRGQPSLVSLVALARAARVSVEWLATGREPGSTPIKPPPGARRTGHERGANMHSREREAEFIFVPRSDLRATRGSHLRSPQVVDYLAFKAEWVQRKLGAQTHNLLLIEQSGDSMSPTLQEGDLLLVDLGEPRFRNDGVYVLRRDDTLAVKRLQRRQSGELVIRSDNSAYEPQIGKPEQIQIIGRVIWAAGRM